MNKETILNKKRIIIETNGDADESVFHEIFTERGYQDVDQEIKNAKSTILDIGAHIGAFSVYAHALNPTVKIFAFEPEERNYQLLKRNLKANNATNVMPKNIAIAAQEGQKTLHISEDSHNHSLDANAKNIISSKKVQAASLDKIVEKLTKVDLVKMDCEGAEFEIMPSLSQQSFAKIDAFTIEYHEYSLGNNPKDLKQILERNKFKVQISQSKYDKRMGFIRAIRYTPQAYEPKLTHVTI